MLELASSVLFDVSFCFEGSDTDFVLSAILPRFVPFFVTSKKIFVLLIFISSILISSGDICPSFTFTVPMSMARGSEKFSGL